MTEGGVTLNPPSIPQSPSRALPCLSPVAGPCSPANAPHSIAQVKTKLLLSLQNEVRVCVHVLWGAASCATRSSQGVNFRGGGRGSIEPPKIGGVGSGKGLN